MTPTLIITRLIAWVSFLTTDGTLTAPEPAIIDTGAPLSLIPQYIWQNCRCLKLCDVVVQGIVPDPDCALSVIDGVIAGVLQDDTGQASEVLTIRAHLALNDNVPLLLGFAGLLNRANVCFSVEQGQAYLEI